MGFILLNVKLPFGMFDLLFGQLFCSRIIVLNECTEDILYTVTNEFFNMFFWIIIYMLSNKINRYLIWLKIYKTMKLHTVWNIVNTRSKDRIVLYKIPTYIFLLYLFIYYYCTTFFADSTIAIHQLSMILF